MSDLAKHPWLTTRGSTYYVRAPLPTDIADTFGKKEVTYSLRTKSANDARRLIVIEAKKVSDTFEAHRQGCVPEAAPAVTPLSSPLDVATLRRLCDDHYQATIDEDFAWRTDLLAKVRADGEGFGRGDYIEHPRDEWYAVTYEHLDIDDLLLICVHSVQSKHLAVIDKKLALADVAETAIKAEEMAKQQGLTLTEGDRRRLARKLLEAEIEARRAILAKDQRRYDAILAEHNAHPSPESSAVPATKSASVDPGPVLTTLIDAFVAEGKRAGLVKKSTMGNRSDLLEFVDVAGDKTIRTYVKTDGVKFKEALLCCPAQRKVAPFKGMTIAQAVKR